MIVAEKKTGNLPRQTEGKKSKNRDPEPPHQGAAPNGAETSGDSGTTIGRFRNHEATIPEPRKARCAPWGGSLGSGVNETTIENGNHRFMGQSIIGPGGGVPAALSDGFFICDLPWAVPKDDMASMEHPLFSLATRPDRRVLRYTHGEAAVEDRPSFHAAKT
jgi:hypothetical protein